MGNKFTRQYFLLNMMMKKNLRKCKLSTMQVFTNFILIMNDNVKSRKQNWSFSRGSFYSLREYYSIRQIYNIS